MEKIIHQIIIGSIPNKEIELCISSWNILIPEGFKVKIWNDDAIRKLIRDEFPFALEIYNSARNPAEASDIGRYLIVYYYGGYYVDWDIQLLSKEMFIELHRECENGYLLVDPTNNSLSSEHFSASKCEEYFLQIVKDIIEVYNRGEQDVMNTPNYTGPYRMSSSLSKFGMVKPDLISIKDIFEYDYWEIRQMEDRAPTKAMIHYWMHTWIE